MLTTTILSNKSVMIIGINYWPEETGSAPYTTLLAEYAAAQGNQVHVVTGMPYYPSWKIAPGYERSLRKNETRKGVVIHRYRQFVPEFQTALRRSAFEASFFANPLLLPRLSRPDIILGIVPSLGGAGLAYMFSKRFRVPYGLVFQDLVGAAATQCGMPGGSRVAKFTTRIEGVVARHAAEISVISPGFQPYLLDLGVDSMRIRRIPNWTHIQPPRNNRSLVRADLNWPPGKKIVLHAGAMGLKQGLENVVNAARAAVDRPGLHFVLMGDGNQRAELERRADGLPNLTFLPLALAETFPDILAAADILLINERASMLDMALPSKLTSYLVAGRPIVAAVSPDGWTAKTVNETRAGVVVPPEDPESLVQMLVKLSEDPDLMEALGQAGPTYAASQLQPDTVLSQYMHLLNDIQQSVPGE